MAMIAVRGIIWQSDPELDEDDQIITNQITGEPVLKRIEVAEGKAVPKVVPEEVVEKWFEHGLVVDDPKVEAPEDQEGPPLVMAPLPRKPSPTR